MKHEEEREKVLVPVRRCEPTQKEEILEELPDETTEGKIWETPRRWRVY